MNVLTQIKNQQKITAQELERGVKDSASWHDAFKGSAYVFCGGIPYDLTEGDLITVFAQYGEIVDCNLVRDQSTGKSRGFAYLAFEDQRSTNVCVDNLNGYRLLGFAPLPRLSPRPVPSRKVRRQNFRLCFNVELCTPVP